MAQKYLPPSWESPYGWGLGGGRGERANGYSPLRWGGEALLSFSKAHRNINALRIGFVASEITKNRGVAICAPIAPYEETRREIRGRKWAKEHGFDAILSTDGDGDRPLFADETGTWMRGDVVGLLCARYLGATTVATPVSCNTAIERCGAFKRVVRTRIGSPYVIDAMEKAVTEGDRRVVGFEANGGFLLGSGVSMNGREIDALPTRDAVLPMLCLLAEANASGGRVSDLPGNLPRRFTASDRIRAFDTARSRALIEKLAKSADAVETLLGDLCGRMQSMDTTDGLRMYFENDDIVHLRPSGNAPELRCYAEAGDPERAAWLVEQCLARVEKAA